MSGRPLPPSPSETDKSVDLGWSQTGAGAWSYTANSANPGNGEGTILATPIGTQASGQIMEPLPIVFTNTFYGRMIRQGNLTTEGNMIVSPSNVGGSNARGLEMWQGLNNSSARTAATVHNDRQTITFDFGRPVTNFSFTITDVDSSQPNTGTGGSGQYRDAVYVSIPPTSAVLGNRVTGSGTQTDPWTPSIAPNNSSGNQGSALNNSTSDRGNITLTYAGPIQSLSVTFYNTETRAVTGNGQQAIYFTNFDFNANSCIIP